MSATPARRRSPPPADSSSSFRLRHLLGLLILGAVACWLFPRGKSAWQLHNLAVTYADYGLCMVGPLGPELLRSDRSQFLELSRRRVLSAAPLDRPFQSCHPLALRMQLSHAATRIHGAQALDFTEHHHSPSHTARYSVNDLVADTTPLDRLATRAWPFVRSGPAKLMKPSSHAREAAHPASAPRPGWGSGLPERRFLYRSTAPFGDTFVSALGSGANGITLISKNRGVDWVPGGGHLVEELRDHCVADEEGRAFTLSRLNDGRHIVLSQGPSAAPGVSLLAPAALKLASISCDASALVAALVEEPDASGHRPVQLRICPFRRPCQDLTPPDLAGARLYYPADVARLEGDIVLARTWGGVTRVASSRDGGRSWTPWMIAFDRQSAGVDSPAPFRLLVAADMLLLYTGDDAGGRYPLLVSHDHGASFIAPAQLKPSAATPVASTR